MINFKILLVLMGVGILGCSFDSDCLKSNVFSNCISCRVSKYSEKREYNLKEVSSSIDSYFLKKGYLVNSDKQSYLRLFKEKKYLEINVRDFIKDVDDTFLSSPELLDSYIECARKNDGKESILISILKNDIELIFNNQEVRLKSLTELDDSEFDKFGIKLFFQVLVYLDISS